MVTAKAEHFQQERLLSGDRILIKNFEIYPAESGPIVQPESIIREIKPTTGIAAGRLWLVSFPFNAWVWESDPYQGGNGEPARDWQESFDEFPKGTAPQHAWSLAMLPRRNRKASELSSECEAALSGWFLKSQEDIWSNRINIGEDLLFFGVSRGVFAGAHLPEKPFIWFLLQQLLLDSMDKRIKELSRKTSGKLANLFKVTPRHLLKHNELTAICAEISSIRLRLDLIEESVSFPRRYFTNNADRKTYSALNNAMDLEDELETLSDRLETLEDIYEVMGERITEYRYFLSEMLIEAVIVLVLLWEIYLLYKQAE